MEATPSAGGPVINGIGAGGFRIGETSYAALLMTFERAIAWEPPPLEALALADLAALIETAPEFILLGTGPTLIRPAPSLARALTERGIGLEPMDSRAAARAWGVLRGEGRRIGAGLYGLSS